MVCEQDAEHTTPIHTYIHTYTHTYVYPRIHTHECICVDIYIYMCLCGFFCDIRCGRCKVVTVMAAQYVLEYPKQHRARNDIQRWWLRERARVCACVCAGTYRCVLCVHGCACLKFKCQACSAMVAVAMAEFRPKRATTCEQNHVWNRNRNVDGIVGCGRGKVREIM